MGNNAAYLAFEHVVLATYNKGVLDAELLEEIAAGFRDVDADPGDAGNRLANDGLDVFQIIVKVAGKELPQKPDLPEDYTTWDDEQSEANDAYHDALHALVDEILRFE